MACPVAQDPALGAAVAVGAVVVGVDESRVALQVLDWAADQAAQERRPLLLTHATGQPGRAGTTWLSMWDPAATPTLQEIEQHGSELLSIAAARVVQRHASVEVRTLVVAEDPGPRLVALSRTAQLTVLGSRGRGVRRAVPNWQVGAWVAHRASGPVVVVPEYNRRIVRQGVLAAVDLDSHSPAVLAFAYRHASTHHLPLTVLHVSRETSGTRLADCRRLLAEAVSGLSEPFPDVDVRLQVLNGWPAGRVLRSADRMNLLVVGRHQATGLHEAPIGHLRTSIVDRSPCPIAVVPEPSGPTRGSS